MNSAVAVTYGTMITRDKARFLLRKMRMLAVSKSGSLVG